MILLELGCGDRVESGQNITTKGVARKILRIKELG